MPAVVLALTKLSPGGNWSVMVTFCAGLPPAKLPMATVKVTVWPTVTAVRGTTVLRKFKSACCTLAKIQEVPSVALLVNPGAIKVGAMPVTVAAPGVLLAYPVIS